MQTKIIRLNWYQVLAFAGFGFVCLVSSKLFANITNQSNEMVQVEIAKKDGASKKITIYPGQSATLPDDSAQVTVVPRSSARGDGIVLSRADRKIWDQSAGTGREDGELVGWKPTKSGSWT